jgi:hypothetical protein
MITNATEFLVLNPSDWTRDHVQPYKGSRPIVQVVSIDLEFEPTGYEPSFLMNMAPISFDCIPVSNEHRMCSVCHGQKVYYLRDDVGMLEEHDCPHCGASGIETTSLVNESEPF